MERPERPKSRLYALQPLVRSLPEVEIPKRHISFKEKFMWCGLALVLFLIMCQIPLYGIEPRTESLFGELRYVLASHAGSLMELGIGPIVTAGIIMQLLVGSKIIGLDLHEPEDRALFTGVQKLLAMIMAVFEGSMLVLGGWYGSLSASCTAFLILQLFLGALVVLYLDELVSKYGFGSGIGLFIVAGVTSTVFWQAFSPFPPTGYEVMGPTGAVPNFIQTLTAGGGLQNFFSRGYIEYVGLVPTMFGLMVTIVIFVVVVYANSIRVEIPLAYGRFGGIRGRYPLRFFYASVIPVILAMAVFANLQILARVFPSLGGLTYYTAAPHGIYSVVADPLRAVVYFCILVGLCTGFAWLWINMTGMGPRDVAEGLDRSGMLIPGFRRDIRVMERVLSRYIFALTLLGGAVIGALSAVADFMGALGSGTGILLTVGIIYSLYEEITRERVAEMFPAFRRFFGE